MHTRPAEAAPLPLQVWEKGVKKPTSSRSSALYLGNKGQPASHRNGLNQQAHLLGERRREKENTTEFIAKKREMFLVQMSLDTKKEEIRKLEQKAKLKEEALRKSELMLESDAIRFDKFLKENDRNAHEAIKHHDEESKAKQEKVAEIKKLNHEIAKVQSEMSKYSEQLDDCLKYKEFLDKLTPASEKEALEQKKQERLEQRRLRSEAKRAARLKRMEGAAQEAEAADETNGDQQEQEHSETALAEAVEDGEQSGDEEEEDFEPIYFTKPQQLIDIFSALEERNLFLIQNSQETEEALEELKKKYEDTKVKTEQKTSALTKNIEELRSKIAVENEKAARLEKRVSSNIGVGKQEQMLHELGQKVTQVCMRCGLNPDSNPDTLDKLAQIERKLEYLIKEMSLLPQDYVRAAEKVVTAACQEPTPDSRLPTEADGFVASRRRRPIEGIVFVRRRCSRSRGRTRSAWQSPLPAPLLLSHNEPARRSCSARHRSNADRRRVLMTTRARSTRSRSTESSLPSGRHRLPVGSAADGLMKRSVAPVPTSVRASNRRYRLPSRELPFDLDR